MILIASSISERDSWYNAFQAAIHFKSNAQKLAQSLEDDASIEFNDLVEEINKGKEQLDFKGEFDDFEELEEEESETQMSNDLFKLEMERELKSKLEDTISVEDMKARLELEIQDMDGNYVAMKNVVDKRSPTLIILLRHYGW